MRSYSVLPPFQIFKSVHGCMQLIEENGKLRKTTNFKLYYFPFTVTVCERINILYCLHTIRSHGT